MAFKIWILISISGYVITEALGDACTYKTATPEASIIKSHPLKGKSDYEDDYYHCWIIQTDVSKIVELTVVDFALEQTDDCEGDYLAVYSGASVYGTKMGQYCGSVNFTLYSPGDEMYLEFKTDNKANATRKNGFELSYRSITKECTHLTATSNASTIKSHSEYGKSDYENNYYACWIIQTSDSSKIVELTAIGFELEYDTNCDYDYLAVYGGSSDSNVEEDFSTIIVNTSFTGALIGQYCGAAAFTSLYSSGDEMYLEFKTDMYNRNGDTSDGSSKGFELSYRSVDHEDDNSVVSHSLTVADIIGITIGAIIALCLIGGFLACVVYAVKSRSNLARGTTGGEEPPYYRM